MSIQCIMSMTSDFKHTFIIQSVKTMIPSCTSLEMNADGIAPCHVLVAD